MYPESDLLPLSGLQHLVYCERQWGLIHLEQAWEENRLTAEGRVMHERVDEPTFETRGDVRTVRALKLRSLRLGISGQADAVEYHRLPMAESAAGVGVAIRGAAGLWAPFPVEYKRGKPKAHRADEVQLCAQSLCLEEMLGVMIPAGALFYGETRRREDVTFDVELREMTERFCARMQELFASARTPPAIYEAKKCTNCSLIEVCRPQQMSGRRSASAYMAVALKEATGSEAAP
ncbi:CRISPR-associated protein Cas4 [soil metagenome]